MRAYLRSGAFRTAAAVGDLCVRLHGQDPAEDSTHSKVPNTFPKVPPKKISGRGHEPLPVGDIIGYVFGL